MVDLGVNYVHLLPVYDINSVDETTGGYNWGYDPKNYNVPEGSYSTDPYSRKMTIQPNDQMVNTEAGVFAFFNDTIRNVIHGGVFTATDKGFVAGNMDEGTKATVTMGYMGNSNWGSDNASVDTPCRPSTTLPATPSTPSSGVNWQMS